DFRKRLEGGPDGEYCMQFEIIPTEQFENDVRYYVKKKKYRHLMDDVNRLVENLEQGHLVGDTIPGLVFDTNETIKVRMANTDTNVGKSNGYRLIYYVVKDDREIYLLTIYYKKADNHIPTNEDIKRLVQKYCF
ncbi:MAG: hypothetical protein MR316_07675, partial [Lachnospiraceae bacterium]|nr:hypothetical protein [Lachnospiraceae bacterium]